jgi:hypothetical protein
LKYRKDPLFLNSLPVFNWLPLSRSVKLRWLQNIILLCLQSADPRSRAVEGVSLWLLPGWNWGLESRGGMKVCFLWVLFCQLEVCDGTIIRPEESYRVWCVWVWSRSIDSEEAMAHWSLTTREKKKILKQRNAWWFSIIPIVIVPCLVDEPKLISDFLV